MRCLLLNVFLAAVLSASPELDRAIDLYREKDYKAAVAVLEPLAREGAPEEAEAAHWMGRAARKQGAALDAIRWHERAVGLKPREPEFWIHLGDAYGLMAQNASIFGKLEWARKCDRALTRAVELAPGDFEARSALIDFCLQAPEMAGGGKKRAFAEAQALKATDLPGGARLEVVLYEREKRWDEALATLREALRQHPKDYALLFTLGRTSALAGRVEADAVAALETCLQLANPPGLPGHFAVWYRLGNLRELNGDRDGALTAYKNALEANGEFEPARTALDRLSKSP